MFKRLRHNSEIEGTGMSLALIKKIVESYGGTITLNSEEGVGATFRFTWPMQEQPKAGPGKWADLRRRGF